MKQYSKGFTLVELVIVIAIIGILAGIAISMYTEAQATARGAAIIADMRTIQSAQIMHLAKYGQMPVHSGTAEGFNTQIKVEDLVKEGYLDHIPVPPAGKAIFPNAEIGELTIPSNGSIGYVFYKHNQIDSDMPSVCLSFGTDIPLEWLLPQK
ncbi:prepilin-type N-terminal cleavage/methylation domain-containing protein [Phascolarctobacterium faecium]|uniref:prepilin-type N-terminal cleavage/methylation domain-containing protein n=1 Tax=Phascolarctobacterium faecium TaxID=33025 RepID=UPI00307ACCD4